MIHQFIGLLDRQINLNAMICASAWSALLVPISPSLAAERSGIASVYSTESGNRTASGQGLNPADLTAAHRTLPFGTKVLVTNKKNGRSAVVTINDRGPFVRGRIIDLSPAGARSLGFSGLTDVSLEVVEAQEKTQAKKSQ